MPYVARLVAISIAILLSIAVRARAESTLERRQRLFDQQLQAEVEKLSRAAATTWRNAGTAARSKDYAAAEKGYQEVVRLLPTFSPARRRLCGIHLAQQRRAEALASCREALALESSSENEGALARVLLSPPTPQQPPSSGAIDEAVRLAVSAASRHPDDPHAQVLLCSVAVSVDRLDLLRPCVGRLRVAADDEGSTHYFAALLAAFDGRWSESSTELERARQLGIPAENLDAVKERFNEVRPETTTPLGWMAWCGLRLGGAWLGLLLLLLVAGRLLSWAAARAAASLPREPTGRPIGIDALARRLYRAVLWLCSAFYYLSIPLVLGVVFLGGGAMIYLVLAVGHVRIKLVLIVIVVLLSTLWAVLKSLFAVGGPDGDPGTRLDLRPHPQLRAILDEVAAKIGTRPVDNIYLTPHTDLAVTERGADIGRQLRGASSERCLILGVGVLDGMSVAAFKAILAHEYGHFQNRDTSGGAFALAVQRSLLLLCVHLAQGGVATWYNPAWWFVLGFCRMFFQISYGASRLQEVLCDRWAAFAYGGAAFEKGLRHAFERSARFDAHMAASFNEVIERRLPLANLYSYRPASPPSEAELKAAIDEALQRLPSPNDSHPPFAERIRLVRALDTITSDDNGALAWSLFADRAVIERRMTSELRELIAKQHGVRIPVDERQQQEWEEPDATGAEQRRDRSFS